MNALQYYGVTCAYSWWDQIPTDPVTGEPRLMTRSALRRFGLRPGTTTPVAVVRYWHRKDEYEHEVALFSVKAAVPEYGKSIRSAQALIESTRSARTCVTCGTVEASERFLAKGRCNDCYPYANSDERCEWARERLAVGDLVIIGIVEECDDAEDVFGFPHVREFVVIGPDGALLFSPAEVECSDEIDLIAVLSGDTRGVKLLDGEVDRLAEVFQGRVVAHGFMFTNNATNPIYDMTENEDDAARILSGIAGRKWILPGTQLILETDDIGSAEWANKNALRKARRILEQIREDAAMKLRSEELEEQRLSNMPSCLHHHMLS